MESKELLLERNTIKMKTNKTIIINHGTDWSIKMTARTT